MATKNINASWQFTKDAITVAEGYSVLTQGNWEALDLPFNSVTELSLSPSAYIVELTVHSALAFSAALAVMLNKPSGNESPDMIKANAINIAELLRNHSLLRLDFIVHTLPFLTIQCFVTFTQN